MVTSEEATSNADIMRELRTMRIEWTEHIIPLVGKIEELIAMHGDPIEARARIAFVGILLEREADRKRLRKAIIEKTLVGAVWVALGYMVIVVGNDIRDVILDIVRRGGR